MRHLLVILACAAAVLAQEVAVEKALVHVQVDDYARLQAERLFENGAPVRQLKACRVQQPYTLLVSGAVISPDGDIVTPALHPRASLRILVTMHDGARHLAELRGTDPESGLALVKVPVKTEHYLKLDDQPLARMQEVRVLGHAADDNTPRVVQGIAKVGKPRQSVRLRNFYTGGYRYCAMPTAVTLSALFPRLGALCVNEQGNLCGLRISGLPPGTNREGKRTLETHLLVPAPRIARIVADLREHGRVLRVTFGARVGCVPDSLRAHFPDLPASAAAVVKVKPDSPAAAAGLQPNDVILKLDGETFRDAFELWDAMSDKPAGKPVRFDVLRKGKKLALDATPVERD
jgi:serine protease DegS